MLIVAGCSVSTQSGSVVIKPSPIDSARKMVGMNERTNRAQLKSFLGVDPVRIEWCAAFVNAHLNLMGIPGSGSNSKYPLTARSFLGWGEKVEDPQLGDVVVFPRGSSSWQGHVGFYIRSTKLEGVEYYVILGGNQDDSVSYAYYRASSALSVRRFSRDLFLEQHSDYVLDGILLGELD